MRGNTSIQTYCKTIIDLRARVKEDTKSKDLQCPRQKEIEVGKVLIMLIGTMPN